MLIVILFAVVYDAVSLAHKISACLYHRIGQGIFSAAADLRKFFIAQFSKLFV